MAKVKGLNTTNDWNQVAFPIRLQEFGKLLPGYHSVARDRQTFIVGTPPQATQPVVFGLQGSNYSLFPNEVIQQVVERVIGKHKLNASYTDQGEYNLRISLPEERFEVRSPRRPGGTPSQMPDTLQKALIITNSYSGKSPFTIQGKVLSTQRSVETTEFAPRMRVSYHRLICDNGLMGWADEFYNLDEYATWLAAGKPTNFKKVLETKTTFEPAHIETKELAETEEETTLPYSRIRHKGFSIKDFERTLSTMLGDFVKAEDSLTRQIYVRLAEHTITRKRAEDYFKNVKVPKKLIESAITRMDLEANQLGAEPNLWLLYNGLNHSLFHQPSSLSINQRFDIDGSLFHRLTEYAL